MITNVILFIFGFFLLIKGADILVKGSSSIAKRFGISDFIIGLTIVAIGTSAPEFVVSFISASHGEGDIMIGNVVGSNISNTFLILGLCAIVSPLIIGKKTIWREIPMLLILASLAAVLLNDFGQANGKSYLTFGDGIVLVLFFLAFIYYIFSITRRHRDIPILDTETINPYLSIAMILFGLFGLILGAEWIVRGATFVALQFGLSKAIVGLTIVAVGTSLPELAASIMAAKNKKNDIAVANIIGSNVFNLSLVLGFPALFYPVSFSKELNVDIAVLLFSTLLLFIFMFIGVKKVLERWQGIVFVSFYLAYVFYLIFRI